MARCGPSQTEQECLWLLGHLPTASQRPSFQLWQCSTATLGGGLSHGWQRHMGQGIDTHTYYLPPGTERVRGVPVGIPDKDYFISTDLAIAHVQRNYDVLSRVP